MTNRKIQLTTVVDGQTVDVFPNTKSEFVEFADGKTLEDKINKLGDAHGHSNATPDKDGFMSKEDKAKLDNVTNYTHPSTHAATMITEDATHRFVTDAEKTKWDNKADTTMASKTNAGLMSASDKQRIDGLNAEFKTRDDKITKNTEDIKSWNDEMINKEYQYFNGENITINNSIVSKTTDMVIKGKTFQNIIRMQDYAQIEGVTRKEGSNFVINKTMTAAKAMPLHKDKIPLLKPNTTYTVMANITNNNMTMFFNLIHCYEKIMLTKNDVRIEPRQNGSICKTFTTIDNLDDGSRFEIIFPDGCTGSVEIRNMMIFEGDLTSIFIDNYFEGIKSFGELKDAIKISSISKNIFKSEKDHFIATPGNIIPVYDNVKDLIGIKTNGVTFKAKISMSKDFVNDNHFGFDIQFLFSDGTSTWSNFTKGNGLAGINPGDTNRYFSWFCNFGSVKTISSLQQCFIFTRTSVGTLTFSEIQIIPYKDINNEEYEKACTDEKVVMLPNNFTNGLMGLSNTVYDEANNISKKFTKRISKMEFNGNENNGYSIEDKGDNWKFGIRIPDAKPESTVGICNTFANVSSNMDEKTTQGFRLYTHNPSNIELRFAINKRILNTGGSLPTNNDIKNFFKNNPTVVFYELNNPIEIDFEDDLNLKTFNKMTYIKTDDFIKANMNFTVAMNTAANLDINSLRLNDVENFVKENKDNKNKISKLEEGAVTSSLNIVNLQREIENNDNYTHYKGNIIITNNTPKEIRKTSNIAIKGKSLKNLYKANDQVRETENYLIVNTPSECQLMNGIFYIVNNTSKQIVLNVYKIDGGWDSNPTIFPYTITKLDLTGKRLLDFLGMYDRGWTKSDEDKNTLRNSCIVFDKEENFIPENYFEGVSSVGEKYKNGYKVSILSRGKNLLKPPLEDITKPQGTVNFTLNNLGEITLNGQNSTTGGGRHLFSNIYNYKVEKNKTYTLSYEYVSGTTNDNQCPSIFLTNKDNHSDIPASIVGTNNKSITFTANKDMVLFCGVNINVEKSYFDYKIRIQLEEGSVATSYKPYEEYRKDILIKEPLNEDDYLYEDNGQIKIYRKSYKYIFDGENEDWIVWTNSTGDTVNAYVYFNRMTPNLSGIIKPNSTSINDRLPANQGGHLSTKEGFKITSEYFAISIHKSKLGITNVNDPNNSALIKNWLKENPLTMVCQRAIPVTEVIENCVDINLKIYREKTYINCLNNIKGELSFDIPNNLATQIKENTNDIDKSINAINSINDKTLMLENAQMSTALSILELQKHTSMLDNGKVNEYEYYIGNSIECDNTLDSRTENMIIKGLTLHNIQKKQNYSFPTNLNSESYTVNLNDNSCEVTIKNYESGKYYYISAGLINFPLLKPNTTYSIIAQATDGLNPCIRTPSYTDPLTKSSTPFKNGVATITTNDLSAGYKEQVLYINIRTDMLNSLQYLSNVMMFEGDWTNRSVPKYFEEIGSVGDKEQTKEEYKINILSNNKNLINLKKVLTEKNINYVLENDAYNFYTNGKLFTDGIFTINNNDKRQYTVSCKVKLKTATNFRIGMLYTDGSFASSVICTSTTDFVETEVTSNPNKQLKLIRLDWSVPGELSMKDLQIEIGNKKTSFEPHIFDERIILLKEPLQDNDFLYEDNEQVKVYRKKKQYTFTGNESIKYFALTDETTELGFEFLDFKLGFKTVDNNFPNAISNRFKVCSTVYSGSSYEGIALNQNGNTYIRISKDKLSTPNVDGIKAWLKANPTTVVYELAEPTTEILENCADMNVNTYKNKTYITTDNQIKGELEFKTQNNFGTIMKNVNRCISKIFNSLNNILNIKGE